MTYGPGLCARVLVDRGIVSYYRSLMPKHVRIDSQAYAPHITVVRSRFESPNAGIWGAHEGELVPFTYVNEVFEDYFYFWLDAYSERITEIRQELGLPPYREGRDRHHISLGNHKYEYAEMAERQTRQS